jgi:hypothetical protein
MFKRAFGRSPLAYLGLRNTGAVPDHSKRYGGNLTVG